MFSWSAVGVSPSEVHLAPEVRVGSSDHQARIIYSSPLRSDAQFANGRYVILRRPPSSEEVVLSS